MEKNGLDFLEVEDYGSEYARYWNDIQKSPNLTPLDKLILQKIKSFCKNGKTCFASNGWFSNNLCIHEKSVSRSIKKMIQSGYVKRVFYNGKDRELICTDKTL
jgi:DNA-binding MarR family transcriptional regulator